MARGKRTDPTAAILAKVMHEMGFDSGIIASVAGLPRRTVADIIGGGGPWALMLTAEALRLQTFVYQRRAEQRRQSQVASGVLRDKPGDDRAPLREVRQ